jgi:hypothetical protein
VLRVRHLLPVSSDLVERIERATLAREDVRGGFVPDDPTSTAKRVSD